MAAGRIFIALSRVSPDAALDAARVAKLADLTAAEEKSAAEVLSAGTSIGLFHAQGGHTWTFAQPPAQFLRLGTLLEAAGFYDTYVHRDKTETSVVLTRPAKPSRLEDALANFGWKTATLEPTAEAFLALAVGARQRLVVMTPFLDAAGAQWLQKLLTAAPSGTERILILRYLDQPQHQAYPAGFDTLAPWLRATGVRVFDYALPRLEGKGLETFHAKVVLCDESLAYIGSVNLNWASLEYSMELGVAIRGEAARDVAVVINAMLNVARELKW